MRVGVDTTFLVQSLILEHPGHGAARVALARHLDAADVLVLAPQVLTETVHVLTDPRRFEQPLDMDTAAAKVRGWWDADQVERVAPTTESVGLFWAWMRQHRLGRKRLLDTMLAATYHSHGVAAIRTSDARDYGTFGCFEVLST